MATMICLSSDKTRNEYGLNGLLMAVIMLLCGSVLFSAGASEPPSTVTIAGDTVVAKNAETAAEAFEQMPESVMHLLTKGRRMDMAEYYRNDSTWLALNAQMGVSKLDTLSDDYVRVQITDVSSMEIRRYKQKKGMLFVASYTISNMDVPADSKLYFFNQRMEQLPASKVFKEAKLKDFFAIPKGSATSMKEIEEMVPFPTVEYSLKQEGEIEGRLTVGEYMPIEDYKLIKLFVRPSVKWVWTGKKFELKDKP